MKLCYEQADFNKIPDKCTAKGGQIRASLSHISQQW